MIFYTLGVKKLCIAGSFKIKKAQFRFARLLFHGTLGENYINTIIGNFVSEPGQKVIFKVGMCRILGFWAHSLLLSISATWSFRAPTENIFDAFRWMRPNFIRIAWIEMKIPWKAAILLLKCRKIYLVSSKISLWTSAAILVYGRKPLADDSWGFVPIQSRTKAKINEHASVQPRQKMAS